MLLSRAGFALLQSTDPKILIRFPKADPKPSTAVNASSKQAAASAKRKTMTKNGDWLTTKPKAASKRKTAPAKSTKKKTAKKANSTKSKHPPPEKRKVADRKRSKALKKNAEEIIELSSDGEDKDDDADLQKALRASLQDTENADEALWRDDEEEFEFED